MILQLGRSLLYGNIAIPKKLKRKILALRNYFDCDSNRPQNLFVWVNEEDHMRIVSMEKGDNVRQIIERFAMATQQIQVCLKEQGQFKNSRD